MDFKAGRAKKLSRKSTATKNNHRRNLHRFASDRRRNLHPVFLWLYLHDYVNRRRDRGTITQRHYGIEVVSYEAPGAFKAPSWARLHIW
jgi:hypothetical protein